MKLSYEAIARRLQIRQAVSVSGTYPAGKGCGARGKARALAFSHLIVVPAQTGIHVPQPLEYGSPPARR